MHSFQVKELKKAQKKNKSIKEETRNAIKSKISIEEKNQGEALIKTLKE